MSKVQTLEKLIRKYSDQAAALRTEVAARKGNIDRMEREAIPESQIKHQRGHLKAVETDLKRAQDKFKEYMEMYVEEKNKPATRSFTSKELVFIRQYVPKKYQDTIEDIEIGSEGYWITVKEDYIVTSTDSHTIHEYTIKDLKKQFKYIEKINS